MGVSLNRNLTLCFMLFVITVSTPFQHTTGAEHDWRLAHYLPERHFFAHGWLKEWAEQLEEASDGRIAITIYPNNTLLRLGAIAPGVRDGKAEIGFGPAPESHRLDLLELPFLIDSATHGTHVSMELLAQGDLDADLAGLKTVLLQTNAPSIVHMKSAAVRLPDDLKTQRMRGATPYIRNLLSTLGADPITGYLAPQVYGALESGAVDGTIWPYEAIRIFQLGEQARYHTEVPIFVSALGLFINQEAYDDLPDDLQAIVDDVSGLDVAISAASAWDEEETRGRERVRELGNTIVTPTALELQTWREAGQPIIDSKLASMADETFNAKSEYARIRGLATAKRQPENPPTVLITGANRGLGLAWAEKYAARGWIVFATARRPEAAAALNNLVERNPRVRILKLDHTVPSSIEAMAATLGSAPIDVLVNNAGMIGNEEGQGFGALDPDQFDTFMRVNAMGPLLVTEHLLPNLIAGRQRKIAALSGKVSSFDIYPRIHPGLYYYKASKTALNMFIRNIAMDLRDEGVSAIVLSPGVVNTYGSPMSPTMPGLVDIDTSIDGMIDVLDNLTVDESGRWYTYSGEVVAW